MQQCLNAEDQCLNAEEKGVGRHQRAFNSGNGQDPSVHLIRSVEDSGDREEHTHFSWEE